MPAIKKIGPCTAIVEPGRLGEGDKLGVSATYRNIAAADELPTTINGASTMYEVFEASATKFADRPCLGWRPVNDDGTPGDFKFHTYQETHTMARNLASALASSGVAKGGKVGILSANNVQWMLGIRASDMLAASVVPIYDTLGESAVEYIINHSGLTVALIEAAKLAGFAAVAPKVAGQVRTIVTTSEPQDDAAKAAVKKIADAGIEVRGFEEYLAAGAASPVDPTPPKSDDIACIMYTSGTTGRPKGVMLSHGNIVAAITGQRVLMQQVHDKLTPDDSMLSFLPMAHVFGRVMEEGFLSLGMKIGYWRALVAGVSGAFVMVAQSGFEISDDDSVLSYLTLAHIFGRIIEELALAAGAHIGYWRGNVKLLMEDVAAFKPTLFIAVPRILERVCDAVEAKVAKGPGAARMAFHAAFNYKLFLLNQGVPHSFAGLGVDQVIFKKVKEALGGKVRYIVSGGAPLASHVEDFCNVCMAPVLQGYGLTETCAASFIMLPDPKMGHTVGPPCAATEFRFESVPELKYDATEDPPKGEICIRGPMVFAGYYKDPEKTAAEFDGDGFFHTGDIGTLTPQGCLKIIDRKKNIFKLAQGEYIAVEYVESMLSRNENVEQIWVYGNSFESAIVAVVVPKAKWLSEHPLDNGDAEAKKAMLEELTRTGKEAKLKGFEMVKAVYLEPEQFAVENELMTPSMKLKRPQLQQRYQKEIDAMYAALKASRS
ncbi:hypothetical protein Ndes2526B_g04245 [Nannochloris sp. 'desiccata']